jgi:uncharacterized protein
MSETAGDAARIFKVQEQDAQPPAAAPTEAERQRFRWLDLLRGRGGAEEPATAEAEQQRLRLHVASASRILSPKGPIHAFVAQNPLQGLEHLPFDRAVREVHRLLGGRGYLSNEAFRGILATGRITRDDLLRALDSLVPHLTGRPRQEARGKRVEPRDVCLVQLLFGIDPLPHGTLRWQITHAKATRKFRQDVPPEARATFLARAQRDLQDSLLQVGEGGTLAEWLDTQMGLGLVRGIRARIGDALRNGTAGHAASNPGTRQASHPFWTTWRASRIRWTAWIARTPRAHVAKCLERLGIPPSRREGYLRCIEGHHGTFRGPGQEAVISEGEFAGLWLHHEWQLLREAVPRQLGIRGTLSAIQDLCERDPEPLAVGSLWAEVVATLGLGDAVSLEEQEAHAPEALLGRIFAVARDGGLPHTAPGGNHGFHSTAPLDGCDGDPSHEAATQPGGLGAPPVEARADLIGQARQAMERDIGGIGPAMTLGEFCQRLTGTRIHGQINDFMIRWCAAFLDEGLAGWPMPARERGFYEAWRSLADRDPAAWFLGIRDAASKIRRLPPEPEDAIIAILRAVGIREEHWTEYLTLHLAALPGWAGLVRWRELRPDYEEQARNPLGLSHYLAVRLFYELEIVSALCRSEWGIEGTVRALRAYFQTHPGEYYARTHIVAGDLPDALGSGIVRTPRETIVLNWGAVTHPAYGDLRKARGLNRAEQWQRFAEMLFLYHQGGGPSPGDLHAVYHEAWRLFHLAQLLGLAAEDIRALSKEQVKGLLTLLDELPPDAHGPIWLRAYETQYRDRLLGRLAQDRSSPGRDTRPHAQVIFCLDAREEGIRRHLEAQSEAYETLGTAGFFSLPMIYRPLGDGAGTLSCPIVIRPRHAVTEIPRSEQVLQEALREARAKWIEALHGLYHRLETNFATAYSLIDLLGIPFGITVAGRTLLPDKWRGLMDAVHHRLLPGVRTSLVVESRGQSGSPHGPVGQAGEHPAGGGALGFSPEEQADIVEGQLRMIGLTRDFARLVVFCGHGATTQNNPFAAAYHCGACGGNRGGPNGRAIAAMANSAGVRALLSRRGMAIPEDSHFLGAEHDTAADRLTFFDIEDVPPTHLEEFQQLARDCHHATALHAQERCRRLPRAPRDPSPEEALDHVRTRTVDWAQVYPEWGHAACATMLICRRELTRGLFLDRRAYLQSYDPGQDPDGTVLEEIMAAFIPVVRGITLDYYFSAVDSGVTGVLGAGTKALHNVVGLVGVMQGASGDIKAGLPAQGVVPLHEPMRVQVIVEAHPARVGAIVQRHKILENVFGNQWAHLIAWDPETERFAGYQPDGTWEPLAPGHTQGVPGNLASRNP